MVCKIPVSFFSQLLALDSEVLENLYCFSLLDVCSEALVQTSEDWFQLSRKNKLVSKKSSSMTVCDSL